KVSEEFTSQAAFESHQARSQHSDWGRNTANIARAYAVKDGGAWWALVPHVLGKEPVQAQIGEYAFPGPLRDKLVAAILSGEKTATASLHEEYQRFGEALPKVGELEIVIDSDAKPVCITRNTQVNIVPLSQVKDAHAVAEGEGFKDAAAWRAGHIAFWNSPEFVESMGEPGVETKDGALVVLVSMEVIAITAAVPGVEG
ncbi:ASCH domain-containing protein, partial [Corynebacterium sp.]|uniref:ASCH domain-containing protein n=1 Tax=Corynebacterium sp. TaxID=1720 RepID=UPI0028AF41A0